MKSFLFFPIICALLPLSSFAQMFTYTAFEDSLYKKTHAKKIHIWVEREICLTTKEGNVCRPIVRIFVPGPNDDSSNSSLAIFENPKYSRGVVFNDSSKNVGTSQAANYSGMYYEQINYSISVDSMVKKALDIIITGPPASIKQVKQISTSVRINKGGYFNLLGKRVDIMNSGNMHHHLNSTVILQDNRIVSNK